MLETACPTLPNTKDGKVSHPELLNSNMLKTQYAVRGELYLRAEELRRQGKEIIFTNVGNPQALGQIPLTFNRQVPLRPTAISLNFIYPLLVDYSPV
jgi:glutamate--glyoxylate aminotransferase